MNTPTTGGHRHPRYSARSSTARRQQAPLRIDTRASSTKRLVLTFNGIFELSDREVWAEIAQHGLEYHFVYDALLPWLSCQFCIMAGTGWLVRAARLCFALGLTTPETYVRLEEEIGHTFKPGLSLAEIVAEARRLDEEDGPLSWERGDAIRRQLGEDAARDYLRRLELAA